MSYVFKFDESEEQEIGRKTSNKAAAARMRKSRAKKKAEGGSTEKLKRGKKHKLGKHIASTSDYLEDVQMEFEVEEQVSVDLRHETAGLDKEASEKLLKQVLGDDVHLYFITKNSRYEQDVLRLEKEGDGPLDCETATFQELGTIWIYGPGIHLALDRDDMTVIFIVRVQAFDDMEPRRRTLVQECLKVIMDWTFAVPEIRMNKAHKTVQGGASDNPTRHDRLGRMYALGWHGSMEAQKRIVWYAPASTRTGFEEYCRLDERQLSEVELLYRDGISTLYPAGFKKLRSFAQERQILGFGQLEPDHLSESVFANSLMITRDDFANYQHQDLDAVAVAYGLWWAGVFDESSNRFVLQDNCDHDSISGGSFLFGSYGFGVQFERCHGLVEIAWRGSTDFHSTMKSKSRPSATRFGTSVQITASAAQSIRLWREGESQRAEVVTFQDRVATKQAKSGKRT